MIRSIGIDIVAIARIDDNIARFGERFVDKILCGEERSVYDARQDKSIFLAGRFAAKEAIIKGLGVFLAEKPSMSVIGIVNNESGFPQVIFTENIQLALGKSRCHVSISHDHVNAVAVAIFEEIA
jgi:holo-[acyl-carrier protein] synthase